MGSMMILSRKRWSCPGRLTLRGVVLSRDFTKVIESAWSGRHEYSYRVEVFVNLTQNLCRAKFFEGGIEYKCKWYYTAGKRTYNAIAATLQNAGLEI